MVLSEKLKNNKYLVLTLLFALLNMAAIFLIFGFQLRGDSQSWIDLIHWFSGQGNEVSPIRIIRPLGPLIAVPFEFLGAGAGLIVQNIIFYLLCAFLMFKITELIYHDRKQAFLASLFFVASPTIIQYGLSYLVDTGAWFFNLLSIFLTLLYFYPVKSDKVGAEQFNRVKNKDERLVILNGFLSGMGVLMKENGGLGVLFFGMMILFSKEFGIRDKISKIIRFGVFFVIPIAIVQILAFKYFHFTYLDLYAAGGAATRGSSLSLIYLEYLGQFIGVLGILWIFFFIGLWRELLEKNKERLKIYLALTPPSLSFVFWSIEAGSRLLFIFAPLGILLATRGIVFLADKLGKKRGALMITSVFLMVLILNYAFSWINPRYQFVEIIAKFLGVL